LEVFLHLS
jgi:cysteine synthase A